MIALCLKILKTNTLCFQQSLFLETPAYRNLTVLELVDAGLTDFGLGRLSRSVVGTLSIVIPFKKVTVCLERNFLSEIYHFH